MKAPIKTADEFAELISFTDTMERPAMYRLMVLLSMRLGLRPMEIAGLDSSWLRGDELRIPLGHSKRKSGRSLFIDEEIALAFAQHMDGREGRVFLNAHGQPFTARGISDAFQRLYRRAGQLGSCYSGRRTLANNLMDRGVSVFKIRDVLGHTSIVTTQEYLSTTPNQIREALFG